MLKNNHTLARCKAQMEEFQNAKKIHPDKPIFTKCAAVKLLQTIKKRQTNLILQVHFQQSLSKLN